MPTFYNFRENGLDYSFDDIFVPADLFREGNLWVWGNNQSGHLGNNSTTDSLTPITTSSGGTSWKQVVVGGTVGPRRSFGAAIKTDGTLWTWGNGNFGKLGNADTTDRSTPVTTFAGGTDWRQVSVGLDNIAAIKTDGTLWVWGCGYFGRLGDGTNDTINKSTPITTFAGGTNWKQVSAGGFHTSAIKTDGTLWTWGYNGNGKLGIGNFVSKLTPVTTFAGGTNWKQVSTGGYHTAAVKTDGTLWTWGTGSFGMLGTNGTTIKSTPVTTFAGGTNWKQVSSGGNHIAAIKTDGTIWTWGYNGTSELGRFTDVRTPVTTFSGGTNWADTTTTNPEDLYTLSAGSNHSTAIKTDGTLWVWGIGTKGQLGTFDAITRSTPITTFTGGTNWKQVSNGQDHTSAIKTDGTLWTWGNNDNAQLGRLEELAYKVTPVTTFAGGTNWADTPTAEPEDLYTISAGEVHTAAIKTDGTLWIWGNARYGKLGTNIVSNDDISTPVTTFAGGTNWKQVVGSGYSTLAIKTDGTLWGWGQNIEGELGSNDTIDKFTPVTTFAGGTNWKQISGGTFHASAIKTDGTLWVWGNGSFGMLGTNDTTNRSTPVTTFAGGTNWKQVSSGSRFTSAIKTDGTLWTWGNSGEGRLGRLSALNYRETPVTTFAGGTNWADTATGVAEELYTLSAGTRLSAAIKTDGTLWTWGYGLSGSLGNAVDAFSNRSTPITTFAGGTNWKQVSVGQFKHGAGIKTDGTLWTWGLGQSGMLGNFSTTNVSTPITTFAGGTDWKQVSCGGYYTAAIKTDGTLWTWGYGGVGNLGNSVLSNISTPVTTFAGGTNWKQVSSGYRHIAAIKTDGTLWTWGKGNNNGQLGNGYYDNASTPVTTFAGGTDWNQVSCGYQDTVAAIKTDGTLWMWGEGGLGNGGNTAFGGVSTPVTTFAGGTNWKQVSTGGVSGTAAIKTDGTLWTWGYDDYRLGINGSVATNISTPVTTFAGGTNWKQVSAGTQHTIALKDDGVNKELYVFGLNSEHQLGINFTTTIPDQVEGTDWKQVSSGGRHASAIKTDGTLWAWGNNANGQVGTNFTTNAVLLPITTFAGGTNWKQVSAGGFHTTALKTDGTLWTWGDGGNGSLGINDTTNRSTPVTTFAGGTNWKQVSASYYHTVALKDDGVNKELYVFGNNADQQLGTNYDPLTNDYPGIVPSDGVNWKQVSGGDFHTTAIKTDGTLWGWGRGSGRLGIDDTTSRLTPVTTFSGGTNWKQLSAGRFHTSAIKTDGTLWTWGYATNGILGRLSALSFRLTPVTTFAGGTNWADTATGVAEELYTLSAGGRHSAAIKTDGTLWIWGSGGSGQLGNDSTTRSTPITTFAGGTDWKQVSAGYVHTAAIKTDGTLWTWGNGLNGQLGNGTTSNVSRDTPITTFVGGTDWKQVSAGYRYTAAIKTDGTLWTWGNGNDGRLGNAATANRSTPVTTFAGGTDWKQVSASSIPGPGGWGSTAAIKTDGTLWVWGNGSEGRLGNANITNRSTPVTTFAGGTDWKQVSANGNHTAAVKTDGTLWTWGNGTYGRLGNFSTTNVSTPITTFAGGTDWKQVSSGGFHTSAVKTDETLWVWGIGSSGMLGNFSTTNVSTPITTFAGGTDWKQVSAGRLHIIALKDDGVNKELYVFGSNDLGQLGISPYITSGVPDEVGGTNWKQVSARREHTAAVKTDGTLWTWGYGTNGRLGTNDTTTRSTPVTTFAGGTDWKQVSSGGFHTAAVKTDGTLWTWGYSNDGQLGNNSKGSRFTPVTTFAGGTNWKQVSCGENHTVALSDDGVNKELYLFGINGNGQIGNADITSSRSTPVQVFGSSANWKQVSAGYDYTTVIKTDGTLWVWGNGGSGRLGTNATNIIRTPVTTFLGGTNWKQVSAGYNHTAAVTYDDPVL